MTTIYENFIQENPDFAGTKRYCNVCGFRFAKFKSFGLKPRETMCPICGSLERQRHLYIHLLSIFPFVQNKNILHFAPEKCFRSLFEQSSAKYFDCDINPRKASYQVNITDIQYDNDFFDYIICIHVLEHIVDDIRAMRELHRTLKPGGTAFLCVPLFPQLYENYSIVAPEEREKAFGQKDHVRGYSLEAFCERLQQVGFSINISKVQNFPDSFRQEVLMGGTIVVGRK